MLSNNKIKRIQEELENNPSNNKRRTLKKKLLEHHLASTLPPFEPWQHQLYFINRFTSQSNLTIITDVCKKANEFILDTESVNVPNDRNRPALIQLQAIIHDEPSLVLILEINHLPIENSRELEQIRHLCRIVLDSSNTIYTWGSINELDEFLTCNLFTKEQITMPNSIDVQTVFKRYWQSTNIHQEINCRCESCIGITKNAKWSLQKAVAHELNEWLDKRYTRSPFDIGLDPQFNRIDTTQRKRRKLLSDYAAYDCLSIERLIQSMNEQRQTKRSHRFIGNNDQQNQSNKKERINRSAESDDEQRRSKRTKNSDGYNDKRNRIEEKRMTATTDKKNSHQIDENDDQSSALNQNREQIIKGNDFQYRLTQLNRTSNRSIYFNRINDRLDRIDGLQRHSISSNQIEHRSIYLKQNEEHLMEMNENECRFISSKNNDEQSTDSFQVKLHNQSSVKPMRRIVTICRSTTTIDCLTKQSKPPQTTTNLYRQDESSNDSLNRSTTNQNERIVTIMPQRRSFERKQINSANQPNEIHPRINPTIRIAWLINNEPSMLIDNNEQTEEIFRTDDDTVDKSSDQTCNDEYNEKNNEKTNRNNEQPLIDRTKQNVVVNLNEKTKINNTERRIIIQTNDESRLIQNDNPRIISNQQITTNNVEEKRRRNRIRTIKQRIRHYRTEIIRRGIYPKFSITQVKQILRRHTIPFTAINIVKSKISKRKSLYIGIKNTLKLRQHEHRTRFLFTRKSYRQLYGSKSTEA